MHPPMEASDTKLDKYLSMQVCKEYDTLLEHSTRKRTLANQETPSQPSQPRKW